MTGTLNFIHLFSTITSGCSQFLNGVRSVQVRGDFDFRQLYIILLSIIKLSGPTIYVLSRNMKNIRAFFSENFRILEVNCFYIFE